MKIMKLNSVIKKNRFLISILGMIFGTIIYCFAIVFILDFGQFYAGGVTGISQLFANAFKIPFLKSVVTALINIPLFIIGWKGVSKRFAILSLSSTILQVILFAFFDWLKADFDFNPFNSLAVTLSNGELIIGQVVGDSNARVINLVVFAMLGGFLTGAGCGIALRVGSSTGGMDIVSQRVSLKAGIPFVAISGTIDFLIILAGTIIAKDISVAVYTLIRLFAHIITLDKIHTIYKFQKITIITKYKEELRDALLKQFEHSMTIFPVIGGYTAESKWCFEIIALTFEVEDYRETILKVDPHAFITYTSLKGISGNYRKKVIN